MLVAFNPGITRRPCKSITFVSGPRRYSSASSTPTIRPFFTTRLFASGLARSRVVILAFSRIKSGTDVSFIKVSFQLMEPTFQNASDQRHHHPGEQGHDAGVAHKVRHKVVLSFQKLPHGLGGENRYGNNSQISRDGPFSSGED